MRPSPLTKIAPAIILIALVGGLLAQGCAGPSRHINRFPGYPVGVVERGEASWYGPGFHGNKTANGERYDMHKLTAAHRTLPLGSVALVRSLTSGRQVMVRVNDRGPFAKGRILDLSLAGAEALHMVANGTDRVELRVIDYVAQPEGMGPLRVQAGAFADYENARALLARIQGDFPDGRIIHVDLAEGRRYRVRFGRFLTESEAQRFADRFNRTFGFQSLVIRDDG